MRHFSLCSSLRITVDREFRLRCDISKNIVDSVRPQSELAHGSDRADWSVSVGTHIGATTMRHHVDSLSIASTGREAINEKQGGLGSRDVAILGALCSPLKRFWSSSRCSSVLARLLPVMRLLAAIFGWVTSSNFGPAPIRTGRRRFSWWGRFARTAESRGAFCGPTAADGKTLGTSIARRKSASSDTRPSPNLRSGCGAPDTGPSARVVIISSASRCVGKCGNQKRESFDRGDFPSIRYRKRNPRVRMAPDNEHYAALCRSP